jgi:hypothetical protein
MQFQEGFDIGTLLFPMLIVVGICFLGLVTWLIVIFTRTQKKPDAQFVKPQLSETKDGTLPYILAIRRSGSEWVIDVKGQRANAFNAPYDTATRKEALEALRELARFARDRLQDKAAPTQVTLEPLVGTTLPRPDLPSNALPATMGEPVSGTTRTRPRSTGSTDVPSSSLTVPVLDLAREIGEIVDELLAKSPSLQNHAVVLINARTEGINFVVDGAAYKEVEDIPIPEIRELIRQATREWERR